MQDCGKRLRRETSRSNGELKGSGSDVGKGELSVVAGEDLLAWGLIFRRLPLARKSHSPPSHDRSGAINHGPADVS